MKRQRAKEVMTKLRDECGVTLAEVIIACGLTVILFTAVFGTLSSSMKSLNIQNDKINAQDAATTALLRLERELRQAEPPLLQVVESAGTSETVVFKADLNDDGVSEAIDYQYSVHTRELVRMVNTSGNFDFTSSPHDVVAQYVANSSAQPIFTYYGASLTTPLNPLDATSDIINETRIIKVRLVIDRNTAKPPLPVDMSTEIKLRNFAY